MKEKTGTTQVNPLTSKIDLQWRVHTPNLLREILNNPSTGALAIPLTIFKDIIEELAGIAIKLNDPKLNAIMCRLTLFEQADPLSKEYNQEAIRKVIQEAKKPQKAKSLDDILRKAYNDIKSATKCGEYSELLDTISKEIDKINQE